jgi:K+-transporting ATPase KdpF subunit
VLGVDAVGSCGEQEQRGCRGRGFEGGFAMTLIYALAALVAAILFVYLLAALLKPEWFQ